MTVTVTIEVKGYPLQLATNIKEKSVIYPKLCDKTTIFFYKNCMYILFYICVTKLIK
ncbi:hypothetical protein Hanom_Chr07g00598011 [Helianthus anomalus]